MKNFHERVKRRRYHRDWDQTFLVLCQGQNTEPAYFRAFRLKTATVQAIHVKGTHALQFVELALKKRKEIKKRFDQEWMVFDKDASTDDQFNRAIALAQNERFKIAYSNQAFEYWFILHFREHYGEMPRSQYESELNRFLSFSYDKNEVTAKKMYAAVLERQADAITRAQRIYSRIGNHQNPTREESSTTVYQLVEQINKYL